MPADIFIIAYHRLSHVDKYSSANTTYVHSQVRQFLRTFSPYMFYRLPTAQSADITKLRTISCTLVIREIISGRYSIILIFDLSVQPNKCISFIQTALFPFTKVIREQVALYAIAVHVS